MEETKKIRRSRKRWGYEVEADLNGTVMGTKNTEAMATDRPECTKIVMEGSPQRSVALEEEEQERKNEEKKEDEK